MPSMMTVHVHTTARQQLVPITEILQAAVRDLSIRDGLLHIYSPHTTCAVTINEGADPDVRSDITAFLGQLVPDDHPFRHAEGNSDAHVLVSLLGPSEMIPVQDGRLRLGRWQTVFLAEFDGPRKRQLWLTPVVSSA
jgi:secondary thiamine-phosphate synthase enzyme